MIDVEELRVFVKPFYDSQDMMHDLSHVNRILKAAEQLDRHYEKADLDVIRCGCYFHGMIVDHRTEIIEFLRSKDLSEERISRVLAAARESLKDTIPETLEGKILHDAHLIEGGKTFLIVKSLCTGSLKRQTLEQTIEYMERNILGKFRCYLPEARSIYTEKEKYARVFLRQLAADLEP